MSGQLAVIENDQLADLVAQLSNTRVASVTPLSTAVQLKKEILVTVEAARTVLAGRQAVERVIDGDDRRLLVIVGPCSIHDPEAALEYAHRLKVLSDQVSESLLVVMRVYFEKPRTTVGWKGLISDPYLDGSSDYETGLRSARQLLLEIAELGLPTATEFLDPLVPQYIDDLVSWVAIGARTTESQTHRTLASGLSCPVGFKNGTSGDLVVAADAMVTAKSPHFFVGVDERGQQGIVSTKGNSHTQLILRGGQDGQNHTPEKVREAVHALRVRGLCDRPIIDVSHGNSRKDYARQVEVLNEVLDWSVTQNEYLVSGVMIESNLMAGRQDVVLGRRLAYGQSITDACIGWEDTEQLLLQAHEQWL